MKRNLYVIKVQELSGKDAEGYLTKGNHIVTFIEDNMATISRTTDTRAVFNRFIEGNVNTQTWEKAEFLGQDKQWCDRCDAWVNAKKHRCFVEVKK